MVDRGVEPPNPAARLMDSRGLILAAWLLSVAFDLFLHGGVLARLYLVESPFLLPPEAAFARIPLGYLTFLVLTASLWWLCARVGVRGWLEGLRLGVLSGLTVWGALTVGLYSISTAPVPLLLGWWVGQAAELGLAGAVIGAGLAGAPRGRLYAKVAVAAFLCLVFTVVLQSTGLAPAMKRVRGAARQDSTAAPGLQAAWTEPVTGMEFLLVEPGDFEMGLLSGDGPCRQLHILTRSSLLRSRRLAIVHVRGRPA